MGNGISRPARCAAEAGPDLLVNGRVVREVGDPVAQGVEHRAVAEVDRAAVRRGVAHHPGRVPDGGQQDAPHLVRRMAVVKADAHGHAVRSRGPPEVEHLLRDELAVRHEDRVAVLGLDAGRAPADLEDLPHVAADLDPLALPERAVELEPEAAEDVRDRALEREPDDGGQHRGGGDEREDVEAGETQEPHADRDRDRDLDQVAQDRREVDAEPRQHQVEDDPASAMRSARFEIDIAT